MLPWWWWKAGGQWAKSDLIAAGIVTLILNNNFRAGDFSYIEQSLLEIQNILEFEQQLLKKVFSTYFLKTKCVVMLLKTILRFKITQIKLGKTSVNINWSLKLWYTNLVTISPNRMCSLLSSFFFVTVGITPLLWHHYSVYPNVKNIFTSTPSICNSY